MVFVHCCVSCLYLQLHIILGSNDIFGCMHPSLLYKSKAMSPSKAIYSPIS